jgi:cell division transport system ATP-binding protein
MMTVIVIFLVFTGVVCVLWIGARDVRADGMSAGSLVQFVIYSVMVAGAVGALSEIWGELQRAAGATERLVELLGSDDPVQDPAQPQALPSHVTGDIRFENVDFVYPARPDVPALHGFDLHIKAGETIALVGPSGAGKTTLMKLCYGALLPTAGHLRLFNSDVRGMGRDDIAMVRRRVGVVHQDVKFLDHLPLTENIALPLNVAGRHAEAAGTDLEELMSWVGLTHRADALPPELSGGERQRAALARAVIMSPDVILADEPTGNIDWEMSQRLLHLLVELNRMGKTVLIATHDLSLIRATKAHVQARVLRIANRRIQLAGADL